MKKVLLNTFLLFFYLMSWAQSQEKVIKYGTNGISIAKKKQELAFINGFLISEINYSYNGWQILDSIVYKYQTKDSLIADYYEPFYDDINRVIKNYNFKRRIILEKKVLYDGNFDKHFFLLKDYLEPWITIFDIKPSIKDCSLSFVKTTFKSPIVPIILLSYGIPFNEEMDSCNYRIEKRKPHQLISDEFNFKHFVVKRTFIYSHSFLHKVVIHVKNLVDGHENLFEEEYKW